MAVHDEVSRELKLLTDRREDLVAQRTATINRLRERVHELDPAAEPPLGSLHRARPRAQLAQWLHTQSGLLAELARDELTDVTRLTEAIDALAARIGDRVAQVAPALLTLPSCGEPTASATENRNDSSSGRWRTILTSRTKRTRAMITRVIISPNCRMPRPNSSPKPQELPDSPPKPPSPATAVPPRSRCGRATPPAGSG